METVVSLQAETRPLIQVNASLVQLVERWSPKPNVVGSSPTGRAL